VIAVSNIDQVTSIKLSLQRLIVVDVEVIGIVALTAEVEVIEVVALTVDVEVNDVVLNNFQVESVVVSMAAN